MNRECGIALVLVLWLMLALAGIASSFIYMIRLEAHAVSNQKLEASALALAEAGIVHAAFLLKNDTTISDSLNDEWAKPVDQQLGDGTYSVTIVDEERNVNINYASEMTVVKLGIRQDIADGIIEYRKNNGMLDTLAEIRTITGMDDDSYRLIKNNFTIWGEININLTDKDVLAGLMTGFGIEAKKADTLAYEIADKQPFTSIDNLLGIVGDEIYQILKPVITTTGGININTASESLLSAYGIDTRSIPSNESHQGIFTASSRYFSVTATGNNKGICKTIHAILKRTQKDGKWGIETVYWLEDYT
jgi:type II secretory pathway component PulK